MSLLIASALLDLERAFSSLNVRWYIFGAQAAIFHGVTRVTADLDVTVDLEERSTVKLVEAVTACGFMLRVDEEDDEFIEQTRVVPLVHEGSSLPVDVVIAGPGLEEVFFKRVEWLEVAGDRFPVASAEDVVVMKILSGRARDIEDVEAIVAARGETMDYIHIERLLHALEQALDQSDLLPQLETIHRRVR